MTTKKTIIIAGMMAVMIDAEDGAAIRARIDDFLADWDVYKWMRRFAKWDENRNTWADGKVDPYGVSRSAVNLMIRQTYEGWDCHEGWAAFRAGDGLFVRLWHTSSGTLSRDMWVLIDEHYFSERD